jgi:transcriptional regulator with GAF, ATPase, and Fis domain
MRMTSAPVGPVNSSSAVSAARTILTRLHEVMASRQNAQAKLNTVVEVIGESLHSEVCSIYLLREGMLELFATRGLAQEAVHVTRMAIGEGLVGSIAARNETLNLPRRRRIPTFPIAPKRARTVSTPSRACPSCGASVRWASCACSMSIRAAMRRSRSRRCRRWPWCCPN